MKTCLVPALAKQTNKHDPALGFSVPCRSPAHQSIRKQTQKTNPEKKKKNPACLIRTSPGSRGGDNPEM